MLEAIALSLLIVTIIIVTLILIVIGAIQIVYKLIFNKRPITSPIIELLNNKVLAMTLIIGDIILIALWFN